MGLFGKKSPFKSAELKLAESMPRTKKVQFEPMKLDEVEKELSEDISAVLSYEPVNYYATKNRFLQCTFYYDEDYSHIYMRFEAFVNDSAMGASKIFEIDFDMMKKILRRFGVNIINTGS